VSQPTCKFGTNDDGNRWIECLLCGWRSYNAHDVKHFYCSSCHIFHNDLPVYQAAQKAVDDVMGAGEYVRLNGFDPSKGETRRKGN